MGIRDWGKSAPDALCGEPRRVVWRSFLSLQAEPDVFATTGSDRSIALYDLRTSTPIRKLVMQVREVH